MEKWWNFPVENSNFCHVFCSTNIFCYFCHVFCYFCHKNVLLLMSHFLLLLSRFWPRAMLKGPKRSFVVVVLVLGVESWLKTKVTINISKQINVTEVTKNLTKVAKSASRTKNVTEVTKNVTKVAKNVCGTKKVTKVSKNVTGATKNVFGNKQFS